MWPSSVLSQHLFGRTDENDKTTEFELMTSVICSRSANYSTVMISLDTVVKCRR